nr:MAG TPA: hypothetical protein [Caudoviricetes sp.]
MSPFIVKELIINKIVVTISGDNKVIIEFI